MDFLTVVSIVVIAVMIGSLLDFLSSQSAPKNKKHRMLRLFQKIGLLCVALSFIAVCVMVYSIAYHDHAMLTAMVLFPLGFILTGWYYYSESKIEKN